MSATHTIRTKLIQVVLTLIIPGWIAMAMVIVTSYREERAHVLQNTVGISRALMSAVDRELISSITIAQVLAKTVSLKTDDFAASTLHKTLNHSPALVRRKLFHRNALGQLNSLRASPIQFASLCSFCTISSNVRRQTG